jgi:hypothetical protein
MGTRQVIGLRDVSQGKRPSRRRLLAPMRYLAIRNPEKTMYDLVIPGACAVIAWIAYSLIEPKPALFGDDGLLRFARDLLIMAVPFMIGALAAVAMGAPGPHLDRRAAGVPLILDGRPLTLRQFVCYLLGYLSFLGLLTLGAVVGADLMREAVLSWTRDFATARAVVHSVGVLCLAAMVSSLTVTVFWSLYFLTDIVNRDAG